MDETIASAFASSSTQRDAGLVEMKSMELTEADWDLFLAGAKQKRYRKGEFVLEEGQPTAALFQVRDGRKGHTPTLLLQWYTPYTALFETSCTAHGHASILLPQGYTPITRRSFKAHTATPLPPKVTPVTTPLKAFRQGPCTPRRSLLIPQQFLFGNLRVELRLKNQPSPLPSPRLQVYLSMKH